MWVASDTFIVDGKSISTSEKGFEAARFDTPLLTGLRYFEVDARGSSWSAFGLVSEDAQVGASWLEANTPDNCLLWCPEMGTVLPGTVRFTGGGNCTIGFAIDTYNKTVKVYLDNYYRGTLCAKLPEGVWYPALATFNGIMKATLRTTVNELKGFIPNGYVAWEDPPAEVIENGSLVQIINGVEDTLEGSAKSDIVVFDGRKFGVKAVGKEGQVLSVGINDELTYADHNQIAGRSNAGAHPAAAITESATKRFFTDTERTKLAGLATLKDTMATAPSKSAPANTDTVLVGDSEASGDIKKITWADMTAHLQASGATVEAATAQEVKDGVNNTKAVTPLGFSQALSYQHIQGSASAVWVIPHNLNRRPHVSIMDSAGSFVEGDVNYVDLNNLTVTFTFAFSGNAIVS